MTDEVEELRRRLARAEQQVTTLETTLLRRDTEAVRSTQNLRAAHEFLRAVYRAMPGALFFVDEAGAIRDANDLLIAMLGQRPETVVGTPAAGWFDDPPDFAAIIQSPLNHATDRTERTLRSGSRAVPVLFSATPVQAPGERRRSLVCIALDISDRKRMEAELQRAHKLESVGRLAAGVAHEINTPVQFVNDNMIYVRDAVADLFTAIDGFRALVPAADAARIDQRCDLAFSTENVPQAIDRAIAGLDRIAVIVRSMRVFAHPQRDKAPADLTQAIRATLVVAASEYKMFADVELDLCELPPVVCHIGDVNQALLNIVVNAGQAMGDVAKQTGARGTLGVRTRVVGSDVVISISDTGGGIPDAIRDRIFDPFFTTKDVGRGTGQGLAVAHAVACEVHHGALTFDTEPGRGSTFHVRLPIAG